MDDMTTPQDESPQQAAEPSAPQVEPAPQPSAEVEPQPPVGSAPQYPSAPLPPVAAKLKTDIGFFLLGLFTPIVVGGVAGALMTALSSVMPYDDASGVAMGVLGIALNALVPLMLVLFLVAWLIGKQKGNVRLASFGKGGLWAYAVGALLALLAFGTCVIALSGSGI